MDSVAELASRWQAAGIQQGDLVLVHSNIRRTLRSALKAGSPVTPEDILQSFIEAVGPQGTLMFPLFNFDFTSGSLFDIRSTPSQMGSLSECARLHRSAVRTGHPVYSFSVMGRHSEAFAGIDNIQAYGAESPFAQLRKLNGKISVLDLEDQNSMTFYHHVEQVKEVPYRYSKLFRAAYVDASGKSSTRDYEIFVRDLDNGVLTDVNPAGELMWQTGLYQGDLPGVGSGLRTISANAMFSFVAGLIDRGMALGTLYSIEKNER